LAALPDGVQHAAPSQHSRSWVDAATLAVASLMQASPQQTHDSPQQTHDSPQQTHDSPQQTHDSPQQTHDSPQQTHAALVAFDFSAAVAPTLTTTARANAPIIPSIPRRFMILLLLR
jgi:collagen type VI alpha